MAMKKLYKCRWDRKISGVFGGLGQYFNIDPTILRLVAVALIIPTGIITLPLIYFIAASFVPEGPKAYVQPHFRKLKKNMNRRVFSGICSGIGDYLRLDPIIIRLVFLVLCLITGFFPLIIAYFVGSAIIPRA